MRVPRMQGFPKQTLGLTDIRLRSGFIFSPPRWRIWIIHQVVTLKLPYTSRLHPVEVYLNHNKIILSQQKKMSKRTRRRINWSNWSQFWFFEPGYRFRLIGNRHWQKMVDLLWFKTIRRAGDPACRSGWRGRRPYEKGTAAKSRYGRDSGRSPGRGVLASRHWQKNVDRLWFKTIRRAGDPACRSGL